MSRLSIVFRLLVAMTGVVAGLGFFTGAAGAEELSPEVACTPEATVVAALGADQALPTARLVEGPEVDAAAVPGAWVVDAVDAGEPTTATWSVPVASTDPRQVWVVDGDRPAFSLYLAPGCEAPAVAAGVTVDCAAGSATVTVSTSGQEPVAVSVTGDVTQSFTVAPGAEVAASAPATEDATVLAGVTAGSGAQLVSAVVDCEPPAEAPAAPAEATEVPALEPVAEEVVPVTAPVEPIAETVEPAEPAVTVEEEILTVDAKIGIVEFPAVEVTAATVNGTGGALAVSAPNGTEGPAPLVAITEQAPRQVEPTEAQVIPENARVQSGATPAPEVAASTTPPASLAFTGTESFDLLRLGAALVALGFAVERLARRGVRSVGRPAHFAAKGGSRPV